MIDCYLIYYCSIENNQNDKEMAPKLGMR